MIAMTDRATAAVTVDGTGGARLWPALDGTREPLGLGVVNAASMIALAETREGFAIAIVDEAGGAQLVQLGHDGARLGTTSLPPEPGVKEIGARRDGFVLRTRDERIVWIDVNGKERGSIAPLPGEQMVQLMVRRDRALVAFADETDSAATVRFLTFDTGLGWGPPIALTNHLHVPLSLAPTAQRVAGGSFSKTGMDVIDLDTNAAHHLDVTTRILGTGFASDGSVLAISHLVAEWWQASPDHWDAPNPPASLQTDAPWAIADGVALSALNNSLVVMTPTKTRYLGYAQLGTGNIEPTVDGFALRAETSVRWFDRSLTRTVTAPSGDLVLDDTHALRSSSNGTFFMDLAHHTEIKLDVMAMDIDKANYDSATGTLTASERTVIDRWRIDTARLTAFRGQQLATGSINNMFALDPAVSGYMVLVSGTARDGVTFIVWWPTPENAGAPPARKKLPDDEILFAVDPTGDAYTSTVIDEDRPLRVVRYSPKGAVARMKVPTGATAVALSPDGKALAFRLATDELVLTSLDGFEKWRHHTRKTASAAFSRDGRTIFGYDSSGASSFDRESGAMLATACAWDFGISDTPIDSQLLMTLDACAGEP
ncbi:hypothetical protein BH11MYX2_BH11MYX2_13320 [soil metagenome]